MCIIRMFFTSTIYYIRANLDNICDFNNGGVKDDDDW